MVGVGNGHAAEGAAHAANRILHLVGAARQRRAQGDGAVVLALAAADNSLQRIPLLDHAASLGVHHGVVVDRARAVAHARLDQVGEFVAGDGFHQVERVELRFALVFGARRAHVLDDRVDDQFSFRRIAVGAGRRHAAYHRVDGRIGRHGRGDIHLTGFCIAAGRSLRGAGAIAQARATVRDRLADDVAGIVGDNHRLRHEDANTLVGMVGAGNLGAHDARMVRRDGETVVVIEAVGSAGGSQARHQRGHLLWSCHRGWRTHQRSCSNRLATQDQWQKRDRRGEQSLRKIHHLSN